MTPQAESFIPRPWGCRSKKTPAATCIRGGLEGVKHFALWPLAQAAESCFGTDQWPGNVPVPQGWIEFDVEDIEKATAELKSQGYKLLVATRKEPWGQTVTRLLRPEGLLPNHEPEAVPLLFQ